MPLVSPFWMYPGPDKVAAEASCRWHLLFALRKPGRIPGAHMLREAELHQADLGIKPWAGVPASSNPSPEVELGAVKVDSPFRGGSCAN